MWETCLVIKYFALQHAKQICLLTAAFLSLICYEQFLIRLCLDACSPGLSVPWHTLVCDGYEVQKNNSRYSYSGKIGAWQSFLQFYCPHLGQPDNSGNQIVVPPIWVRERNCPLKIAVLRNDKNILQKKFFVQNITEYHQYLLLFNRILVHNPASSIMQASMQHHQLADHLTYFSFFYCSPYKKKLCISTKIKVTGLSLPSIRKLNNSECVVYTLILAIETSQKLASRELGKQFQSLEFEVCFLVHH